MYLKKEYTNFQDLMKKFESIDFESGKYLYSIYKNLSIKEVMDEYFGDDKALEKLIEELKELVKEGRN